MRRSTLTLSLVAGLLLFVAVIFQHVRPVQVGGEWSLALFQKRTFPSGRTEKTWMKNGQYLRWEWDADADGSADARAEQFFELTPQRCFSVGDRAADMSVCAKHQANFAVESQRNPEVQFSEPPSFLRNAVTVLTD